MEPKRNKTEVGIIVGRFQTPELHAPHIDLIRTVLDEHPKVLLFLGLSHLKATWNNPLDFEARKCMILEKFPEVTILYIKDQKSDEVWSKRLDEMIKDNLGPHHNATLYGGRDSFISHYTGKFPTQELESDRIISATEIRSRISSKIKNTPDFRAGVVWATQNSFPSVMATVDIAILNNNYTECLFGRKENEKEYRFIGGFSDPKIDKTFEAAAIRETHEETGLEVNSMTYICSAFINDWRYKMEKDKVITTFFRCQKTFGSPQPGDDIFELRWMKLDKSTRNQLVGSHKQLLDALVNDVKDVEP